MNRFLTAVAILLKLMVKLEDIQLHIDQLQKWTKDPDEVIVQVNKFLSLISSNPKQELDVYRLIHPNFNQVVKQESDVDFHHSFLEHRILDAQAVADARPSMTK